MKNGYEAEFKGAQYYFKLYFLKININLPSNTLFTSCFVLSLSSPTFAA